MGWPTIIKQVLLIFEISNPNRYCGLWSVMNSGNEKFWNDRVHSLQRLSVKLTGWVQGNRLASVMPVKQWRSRTCWRIPPPRSKISPCCYSKLIYWRSCLGSTSEEGSWAREVSPSATSWRMLSRGRSWRARSCPSPSSWRATRKRRWLRRSGKRDLSIP